MHILIRKRRHLILIFHFLISLIGRGVYSDGLIGCGHDSALCFQQEICIEDGLFGRCQVEPYDLYQYNPSMKLGQLFLTDLERLVSSGARWRQPETQCTLLYYYLCARLGWDYDPGFCQVTKPDQILLILQLVESEMFYDTKAYQERGTALQPGLDSLISRKSRVAFLNMSRSAGFPPNARSREIQMSDYLPVELRKSDEDLDGEYDNSDVVFLVPNDESWREGSQDGSIPEIRRAIEVGDDLADNASPVENMLDEDVEIESALPDSDKYGIANGEIFGASKIIKPAGVVKNLQSGESVPRYYSIFPKQNDKILFKKDDEELGIINQGTGNIPHNYATRKPVHPVTRSSVDVVAGSGDSHNRHNSSTDDNHAQLRESNHFERSIRKNENDVQVSFAQQTSEASNEDEFVVPTLVVCGVVGATLILLLGLYVVRVRGRTRLELNRLAADIETRPGKDYQDLCRQHMVGGLPEPDPLPGFATALSHRLGSQSAEPSPKSKTSSTSSWCDEPVITNLDISAGHMILSYLEEHLSNQDKLNREWDGLCSYRPALTEAAAAKLPQNIAKNRYANIVPYDHSRVLITAKNSQSGSDYINASYITESDPKNPGYIVCQSPVEMSGEDMWQLVWEQGSVVVVNLAMLLEERDGKCSRYWPSKSSQVYHGFEVHLVSEHIWCEDYVVRSFYLKNLSTNETRTVTQFHFLTWEDHGVPSNPKALLEFRRKVNKSYRGRSCPIIVHCSDGSGRSGTYCLLDIVLNRINKGVKEIDIAATLEHLRDQRMEMVETLEQFELVLNCVAEEIQAILASLPQQN